MVSDDPKSNNQNYRKRNEHQFRIGCFYFSSAPEYRIYSNERPRRLLHSNFKTFETQRLLFKKLKIAGTLTLDA